jgi:hypothetical protein
MGKQVQNPAPLTSFRPSLEARSGMGAAGRADTVEPPDGRTNHGPAGLGEGPRESGHEASTCWGQTENPGGGIGKPLGSKRQSGAGRRDSACLSAGERGETTPRRGPDCPRFAAVQRFSANFLLSSTRFSVLNSGVLFCPARFRSPCSGQPAWRTTIQFRP